MKNLFAILALLNNTSAVQIQNDRWIEVPDNFTSLAESAQSASAHFEYQHTPNAAISGHNDIHLNGVSVDDCKAKCDQEDKCNSFDYYKASKACDISFAPPDTKLKTNYNGNPYDNYKKIMPTYTKSAGACRQISDGKDGPGSNVERIQPISEEKCKKKCDSKSDCTNYEYNPSANHCEIWVNMAMKGGGHKGVDCFAKNKQLNPQDLLPAFHELGMGIHASVEKFQAQKVQRDADDHEAQKILSMQLNDGVKFFMIQFAVTNLGLPEAEMRKVYMESESYKHEMAKNGNNKNALAQDDDYNKQAHMDALVNSTDDKLTEAYIKAAFNMHHEIEKFSQRRYDRDLAELQKQRDISKAMLHDVSLQLADFGINKLSLNEKLVKGDLSGLDK